MRTSTTLDSYRTRPFRPTYVPPSSIKFTNKNDKEKYSKLVAKLRLKFNNLWLFTDDFQESKDIVDDNIFEENNLQQIEDKNELPEDELETPADSKLTEEINDDNADDNIKVNKDEIIDIVKDAIEAVDESRRVMPDKRIFVPAIQQLSYSTDDEILKHTYKKLLASSMDLDKQMYVHPSFVNIISQLNADEIKLLNSLVCVTAKSYPLINLRFKVGNQQGLGITQIKYFTDIGYGVCDRPQNICVYLENLERLKLITIPWGQHLLDTNEYTRLENHPIVQAVKNMNQTNGAVQIKYEYDHLTFSLTQFGVNFITVCK